MAICPLPLPLRLALPQTPPVPPRWPPAPPCSPPSLRRRTHAFSKKEKPIQSYKTTTVHLLRTNLQVSLSLLQRQGSDDEDHVLAETEKACDVVLLIARFINACDAVQIRLASEKYSKTKLWSSENPLRGVAPLLAAVHKVQVSTKRLTALHPDCLQLCLLAKCSKAGFSVLSDDDILEVDQPRDFYLHCYYGGMICIGLKRFQKALELLYNVVTAPMHVVNAIALEAYKKYILVTLIHSGQFTISLPKCASTTAKSSFKTWCTPYIDVGMRYNDGKISELEAVVVANSSDFEKKYWTLSLQDIANMVQLANAKEAEMIQDGQIHALINQKDGMVRFLEDPEQYKTSEMIEIMDSVIQRTIGVSKNLIAMDESLSCDPLYLGKVGRERQRYDFGDDFDTVPQKFSM
ncbi:hypothetical protein Bca52824_005123 [Brassica carinata]|uniref:COP9 signalosome complex subunit 3 N-terminal helical repeats domain-containing protein n=1 Tax=Brassica carinata TaxID=52824 RepID=A0A8X7WT47_BRACI|nr:hypothetical protein Bca52824_005123 [Brassica carinata]